MEKRSKERERADDSSSRRKAKKKWRKKLWRKAYTREETTGRTRKENAPNTASFSQAHTKTRASDRRLERCIEKGAGESDRTKTRDAASNALFAESPEQGKMEKDEMAAVKRGHIHQRNGYGQERKKRIGWD